VRAAAGQVGTGALAPLTLMCLRGGAREVVTIERCASARAPTPTWTHRLPRRPVAFPASGHRRCPLRFDRRLSVHMRAGLERNLLASDGALGRTAWAAEAARELLATHHRPSAASRQQCTVLGPCAAEALSPADVPGGNGHFDVLVHEIFGCVAGAEGVVEVVSALRRHGFSFDRVVSVSKSAPHPRN
jgi:hypothetical protein